ncbi:NucA/NucB deoxyribonuclease domain-containing protein [Amycolatopsis thermoflava]|uniref:NucA/NucB deoxyribonuclease domain-containing protein n=1 Tax=Amycolatopsis thermoflava TaxID=84480 RepID=UPI00365EE741
MSTALRRVVLSGLMALALAIPLAAPPTAAASDATASAVATLDDQQDLRQECQQHAEADSAQGWIKSRFESCHRHHYDLVLARRGTNERIGTLAFDLWVLGFAYDGTRRVDYVASAENIIVSQEAADADPTQWGIDMRFSAAVVNSAGSIANPNQARTALLGSWDTTPQWTITYTSPSDTATDPYGIVNGNVQLTLGVYGEGGDITPWSDDTLRYSNIRFDSAGRVAGKNEGAVFTNARVVIPFSLSSPTFPQSARHYNDAINNPVLTFPSGPKNVPGVNAPLHRTLNATIQDANNRAARKTCDEVWGPYDGTLLNCDEYPFATTQEGAAKGDGNYSARLIDARDNQAAGSWLVSNYTLNRLLDGDAFYIAITP